MGSITDAFLGTGSSTSGPSISFGQATKKARKITPPQLATPYSIFDTRTGLSTFDPTIRNTLLGGLDTFTSNLGDTRSRLLSNANPFRDAILSPLVTQLAQGRGEMERGLNRTSVRGTLRDRQMLDYDIASQKAIGEAGALVEDRTLSALNNIDKAMFEGNINTAQQLFNQEFSQLGLSTDFYKALMQATLGAYTGSSVTEATTRDSLFDLSKSVAGFFGTSMLGGTTPLTSAATSSFLPTSTYGTSAISPIGTNGIYAAFPGYTG